MARSIRGTKKSRGRPRTTGPGAQIGMRWQVAELAAIDAWRRMQDGLPSRPVAIRLLVELGLQRGAAPAPRQPSKGSRRKASEMASRELDDLGDKSVPALERERRKRRLVLGPKEFRDVRGDQPKKKV